MRNRQIWLVVAALAAVASMARADAITGEWAVTVTSDDGGKTFEDALTFNPTLMTSRELKKQGFDATAYEADTRGKQTVTFACIMKNKGGGEAKWSGTITAIQIQGTLALTKSDGATINYNFKGERVKK